MEFDTRFGDGIANAGGACEDEYGGVVEFGGEFGTQRGEGRAGHLGGVDGSECRGAMAMAMETLSQEGNGKQGRWAVRSF